MDKSLVLSFVKSDKWGQNQAASYDASAQTGDFLALALILLCVIAAILIGTIVLIKKYKVNNNWSFVKQDFGSCIAKISQTRKIIVIFAALMVMIVSAFCASFAFAASDIEPLTKDINVNFAHDTKVYVDPDGSCSFDDVALKNDELNNVNMSWFSLSGIEKSQDLTWTFTDKNTGDVIFNGQTDQSCEVNKKIAGDKTCELSVNVDIDNQTALNYIGKNVCEIKFSFSPMRWLKPLNVDLTYAADEVHVLPDDYSAVPEWKSPPPHTSGWEFIGWYDTEDNPIEFDKPIYFSGNIYARYKEPDVPKQPNEYSTFLVKGDPSRPQQGMDIYGDYVFSCEDGGPVNVYDYKDCDTSVIKHPIAQFDLGSSQKDNHVNNVDFGKIVYPGEQFPLLYISNGKPGSSIEYVCYVEQIRKSADGQFSSNVVQEIWLDEEDMVKNWRSHGYIPIFGSPSWMIDREDNALWVFSAYMRTIPSVTKYHYQNEYIATKYAIPACTPGDAPEKISLKTDDILDQVIFPYDIGFTQAGCVKDGKIYYCFGVGTMYDTRPPAIRIYDTRTRKITAGWDLPKEFVQEPEDIAIKDGFLLLNCNSNFRKGENLPCIYKFSLPKE